MASQVELIAESRKVARSSTLELVLPECEKGIGAVILKTDSPQLIDGVPIEPVALWPDDRGYLLEVQRLGQGLAAAFPTGSTQISAAYNYPGSIKAFHYHLRQTDCWAPVVGLLQVGLVDLLMVPPPTARATLCTRACCGPTGRF